MADAASIADIKTFLNGWAEHEDTLTPGEYSAEEKSYDPLLTPPYPPAPSHRFLGTTSIIFYFTLPTSLFVRQLCSSS